MTPEAIDGYVIVGAAANQPALVCTRCGDDDRAYIGQARDLADLRRMAAEHTSEAHADA